MPIFKLNSEHWRMTDKDNNEEYKMSDKVFIETVGKFEAKKSRSYELIVNTWLE